MAKKRKDETDVVEIKEGTVEYERRAFLEREKAEYERRTGEKVTWEPDHPLTSTPLPLPQADGDGGESTTESEDAGGSEDGENTPPEGEG